MSAWKGATALVTGGTGTIGSAVVRRLLADGAAVVRVLSRDDSKQFELRRSLGEDKPVRYLIGDVRDRNRLIRAAEGVDLIIHAAAMKHVEAAEFNPFEAVETNVRGTANVIDAAVEHSSRSGCSSRRTKRRAAGTASSPPSVSGMWSGAAAASCPRSSRTSAQAERSRSRIRP